MFNRNCPLRDPFRKHFLYKVQDIVTSSFISHQNLIQNDQQKDFHQEFPFFNRFTHPLPPPKQQICQ